MRSSARAGAVAAGVACGSCAGCETAAGAAGGHRTLSGNALGSRARLSGRVRGGARRGPDGAVQPHRLVQGARRRGARRAGRGARIWRSTLLPSGSRRRYRRIRISRRIAGKSAPDTGFTTMRTWSPPMPISASPTASTSRSCVQQAFGTLDNRIIATIGLRHTFIPEWKWFSPTAGIGTGYQRISDKVPPAPLREQQPDGLRLAWGARIHHQTLHVARRLAPLRRLQQPECE